LQDLCGEGSRICLCDTAFALLRRRILGRLHRVV
jgi:hypothetical protein